MLPLTEERQLTTRDPSLRFCVWPYPDRINKVVSAFVRIDAGAQTIERMLCKAHIHLAALNGSLLKRHQGSIPNELVAPLFEEATVQLLEACLKEIFSADVHWSFTDGRGKRRNLATFATKKSPIMGVIKERAASLEGLASQAFRQSELLALLECLKGEADTGLFGVLTCSSLAISTSGSTLAEFDGVYSIVTSNRIKVCIVESKDVKKRSSSIMRKQLINAFAKLAFKNSWQSSIEQFERKGPVPPHSKVTITIAKDGSTSNT